MLGLMLSLLVLAPVQSRTVPHEVRGAAMAGANEFWTWGERLERWTLPGLRRRTLARFSTREGGCVYDFDGDGRLDLIAPTDAGLAWFRAPRWERTVLDADAETSDCVGAEMDGRRGVLTIHLGAQVRFYERTGYREIYSFYTASYQAGLVRHDVDGDGRLDIFGGNYWVQSPAEFDLPWRLFAINTWSEQARSASARLAVGGAGLLWAESRMAVARVAWFRRPADPRVLWTPVMADRAFAYPQAVAVVGETAYSGENNGGQSRFMRMTPDGRTALVSRGTPLHTLLAWREGLVAVGGRRVTVYLPPRR